MKSIIHKADSRGGADHGWLVTHHTFSFADYYDPERMNFGALRVLNDDFIAGGGGFGAHPHANMEIITIPLEGELEHSDNMGNTEVVRNTGEKMDVQVMSAGTGVVHSEYNKNSDRPVKLLQIWLTPDKKNVAPRYDQATLDALDRHNKLQNVVSPENGGGVVWIHQRAWFFLGKFDKGISIEYEIKQNGNGLYVFVISGTVRAGDQVLNSRDGYGIWDFETIKIIAETDAEFLLMDVPME